MKHLFLITIIPAFFISCNNSTGQKDVNDKKTDFATEIFVKAFTDAIANDQIDSTNVYFSEFVQADDSALIYALEFKRQVESGRKLPGKDLFAKIQTKTELDTLSTADRSKKLETLKKKFIFEKDEFREIGFYTPKSIGKSWPNRKALYAYLNTNGNLYLISNYHSSDWIFHTYVKVLIDSLKYETEIVETYKPNNRTENSGGDIWENISYSSSDDIAQAIAENANKKIRVRFEGREYYSDITLSEKDKQAIKDCWELKQLLSK